MPDEIVSNGSKIYSSVLNLEPLLFSNEGTYMCQVKVADIIYIQTYHLSVMGKQSCYALWKLDVKLVLLHYFIVLLHYLYYFIKHQLRRSRLKVLELLKFLGRATPSTAAYLVWKISLQLLCTNGLRTMVP